jgi:DNA-binding beta-propeller fold protein YncE
MTPSTAMSSCPTSSGVETVLDAGGHRIATIQLGGEAGNVQYDAASRHILVDIQSLNQLAAINPRTNRVIRRVELDGCETNHSLLVDSPRRLAFIACEGNARLLTLDLRTMNVTGRFDVGDAPDVLAFDRSLHRLYVSSESGVVAVFAEAPARQGCSAGISSRPPPTPSPSISAPTSSTSHSNAATRVVPNCSS